MHLAGRLENLNPIYKQYCIKIKFITNFTHLVQWIFCYHNKVIWLLRGCKNREDGKDIQFNTWLKIKIKIQKSAKKAKKIENFVAQEKSVL